MNLNLPDSFKIDENLIEIYTNRGSSLMANAMKQISLLLKEKGILPGQYCIMYYDNERLTNSKYRELIKQNEENNENNEKQNENEKQNKKIIFKTMNERDTWRIDDKREFSRILRNCPFLPKTYLDIESFRENIQEYPGNKIWFAKARGSTSGKGVKAFTTLELKTESIDAESIIQEGVENLVLYKNRKFVIRSYILLHDKKSFLYNKFFSPVHGKEYDPTSTEYLSQISHAGYHLDKEDGVRLINCVDLFADTPGFNELVFEKMVQASKTMIECFRDTRNASSKTDFIILGVDNLLCWKDCETNTNKIDIRFIEINRYPNIFHTSKINKEVNQKMLADTFCKLLNIENQLDNGFIQLTF